MPGLTDAEPVADDSAAPDSGRPPCLERLEPGAVRGDLGGLRSRVVFDREGNLFAVRSAGDGFELVRWTPCLEETWSAALRIPEIASTQPFLRIGPNGEVYVTIPGAMATVSPSGTMLPALRPSSRDYVDLIATRPYPITLSWNGIRAVVELRAFPEDGPPIEEVAGIVGGIAPDYGSCAVARETVACAQGSLGLRVGDLSTLYTRRVADDLGFPGQPATDGARLFTSGRRDDGRPVLRALGLESGEVLWTHDLEGPEAAERLATSAPVFSEGLVFVEHTAGEPDALEGRLAAFDVEGRFRWARALPRPPAWGAMGVAGSHLAIGDTGSIYSASGSEVRALELDTGELRWTAELPGEVDGPLMNISPWGDLAIRTAEGNMLIVATDSEGPATSGWPVVGHDPQATNAYRP